MVRVRRIEGGRDRDGRGPKGLADLLRDRTRAAHAQAERTGIVQDLFRGRATRRGYALYLRNLLPAYDALERAIQARQAEPAIAPLAMPAIYRAPAIEADLTFLEGADWARTLALLPEGAAYADRIASIAKDEPAWLIAHAYTRYLGDLNGGQLLRSLLARTLGLSQAALSFHDFSNGGDLPTLRRDVREAIDRAGQEAVDQAAVAEEGERAFQCNIAISVAVREASATSSH